MKPKTPNPVTPNPVTPNRLPAILPKGTCIRTPIATYELCGDMDTANSPYDQNIVIAYDHFGYSVPQVTTLYTSTVIDWLSDPEYQTCPYEGPLPGKPYLYHGKHIVYQAENNPGYVFSEVGTGKQLILSDISELEPLPEMSELFTRFDSDLKSELKFKLKPEYPVPALSDAVFIIECCDPLLPWVGIKRVDKPDPAPYHTDFYVPHTMLELIS